MKIFNISKLEDIKKDNRKRMAALGFFDGVHKAHQNIIEDMLAQKGNDIIPVVITLNKSPKEYFGKANEESLTPLKKKSEIFKKLGIEEVYYLEFNNKLQILSADQFIDKILKTLGVKKVFCGYDYKFGNNGLGTPNTLKENGLDVSVHKKEEINHLKISTTALKTFVRKKEFENYNKFAGRYYSISGIVIKGRQLGRTINFPTANLELDAAYLLPETVGVYVTKTKVLGKMYKSLTNIGYNPTVSNSKNKKFIETHILDFDQDIYGEKIEIFFYEFLRNEQKFESFDHLKEQLKKDKEICERKDI
ncbi:bifunctional riboflavin kinase/FAD synthetase [Gemella cuniculi]|uniref:bifunctional riboflavin kinase/FAD synthetase n=1 Tax=Gemella cuniculi TaxID=150240 RepID=UPI000423C4D2|nr:bifunctional riboflavin kinase/FAD synthetase [Gemella cuniculi]